MKVINDAEKLKDIEDELNKNIPIRVGIQPKFKASVASIDFNFYDDESVELLRLFTKHYMDDYWSRFVIRQKSTFSRLKPVLDVKGLKNIHTHQIIFFKSTFDNIELHPLHIIPEDGFLKTNLYPKSNNHKIKLSSKNQNQYCQEQNGNQVESWEDLFEKISLVELVGLNNLHQSKIIEHLLDNINLTVSVSLGEGNDLNGKAGLVLTYADILNEQPNIKIKTKYDVLRYELLQRSQKFLHSEIPFFNPNLKRTIIDDIIRYYTPELSTVFSGSNGGGFFDPYYNGINTLCCTLINSKLTNTSYNILTGDIPAAFMLYFPVTNLNEGKYEGYYQGQREIPIPKGEFV